MLFVLLLVSSHAQSQYQELLSNTTPGISKLVFFNDTLYGLANDGDPFVFSADEGEQWSPYYSRIDWPSMEILDAESNDSIMYLLTSQGLFSKSREEGAFRWVSAYAGQDLFVDGGNVHTMQQTKDTTILYCSWASGRDARAYAHPGKHARILLCEGSSIWILVNDKELHHSTDWGTSWTRKLGGSNNAALSLVRHRGKLYGVPKNWKNKLFTSDDGSAWSTLDLPFYMSNSVHVEAVREKLYLVGQDFGVVVLDDLTDQWSQIASDFPDMNTILFAYDKLYGAGSNLFVHDTSRGQWRLLARRIPTESWRFIKATERSLLVIQQNRRAIGMRFNDGVWWSVGGETSFYNIVDVDGVLYDVTDTGMVASVDDGLTWSYFSTLPISCRFLANSGSRLIMLTNRRNWDSTHVMHSDDLGKTWQSEGGFLDDQGIRAFQARDTRRLVCTVQNGPVLHWHYTSNEGASWFDLTTTLQAPVSSVLLTESSIFAQTPYGLWESSDHGASWMGVNVPVENYSLHIAIPRHVVLLSDLGLVFIPIGGSGAKFLRYPLNFDDSKSLASNSTTLFISSPQAGLFSLDLNRTLLQEGTTPAMTGREAFRIEGMYPVPLRKSGYISLNVRIAGTLAVSIIDVLGREIQKAEHSFFQSGVHFLPVTVASLSPGIYILRVTDGTAVATQKLLVQ